MSGGGVAGSPTARNIVEDNQILTTRRLQEIITNLSIQEQPKGHEFWDTQPVPKLG